MDLVVNKAYSLYLVQIAKISELGQRYGMNASEVVRASIDAYYDLRNGIIPGYDNTDEVLNAEESRS